MHGPVEFVVLVSTEVIFTFVQRSPTDYAVGKVKRVLWFTSAIQTFVDS